MSIKDKSAGRPKEGLSPWEKEVQINHVSEDVFTNVSPLWDFKGRNFLSATQLMAQCLQAGYETLSSPANYLLHELHTNFIRAGSKGTSVLYKVERQSDGKGFSTRVVRVEQNGKLLLVCAISFQVTGRKDGSKIMRRSEKWKTSPIDAPEEGRDDVAFLRPEQGCNIEGYVLPTVELMPNRLTSTAEQPACRISPNWMKIRGPIFAPLEHRSVHLMGLLYVSDVFVLDAGPRLSNIDLGFAGVPGADITPDFNVLLTLNSSIHIHEPHGWRCDDWFYVENECASATEDGRFLINSTIFTQEGKLIASSRQEGYSIMAKGLSKEKASI